ncbi:hypothetical protein [Rhodoflexus caldus]|uniref:hypothetical protein n=1 Tax=Rhodoflexus caldus TaxID=2891236 RepID=UPI002029FD7A|nr:hypothetical protein [Rhodoflexus caldus]
MKTGIGEVSESAKSKFEKMDFCRKLIQQFEPKNEVLKSLMEEYGVTLPTAYKIYNRTVQLFDLKTLHIEAVLQEIYKTKQDAHDSKVKALCDKNLVLAVSQLHSIENKVKEIQPPPVELGFFPEILEIDLPSEDKIEEFKKQIYAAIEKDAIDTDFIVVDEKQADSERE